MTVWLVAIATALLWVAAGGYALRSYRRTGRALLRNRTNQAVAEVYDTPDGIAQRMRDAPDDPVPAIRHALLAEGEQDWPEVIRRAEALVQRFPKLIAGHLMLARGLWNVGERDRSRAMMRVLLRRFPEDAEVLEFTIMQARTDGDWKRVATLGRRFRREYMLVLNGYAYEIEALIKLRRIDDAAKVLHLAEREFPDHPGVAKLWEEFEAAEVT